MSKKQWMCMTCEKRYEELEESELCEERHEKARTAAVRGRHVKATVTDDEAAAIKAAAVKAGKSTSDYVRDIVLKAVK